MRERERERESLRVLIKGVKVHVDRLANIVCHWIASVSQLRMVDVVIVWQLSHQNIVMQTCILYCKRVILSRQKCNAGMGHIIRKSCDKERVGLL